MTNRKKQLILGYPFYWMRGRLYFLGRLWLKNMSFGTQKSYL